MKIERVAPTARNRAPMPRARAGCAKRWGASTIAIGCDEGVHCMEDAAGPARRVRRAARA